MPWLNRELNALLHEAEGQVCYFVFFCIDFYKDLGGGGGGFFITSDGREYDTREETYLMCVLIKEHFVM